LVLILKIKEKKTKIKWCLW